MRHPYSKINLIAKIEWKDLVSRIVREKYSDTADDRHTQHHSESQSIFKPNNQLQVANDSINLRPQPLSRVQDNSTDSKLIQSRPVVEQQQEDEDDYVTEYAYSDVLLTLQVSPI